MSVWHKQYAVICVMRQAACVAEVAGKFKLLTVTASDHTHLLSAAW